MRFAFLLLAIPSAVLAQTANIGSLPFTWENGTTPTGSVDSSGNMTTQGSVTTGFGTSASSGQIEFFGATLPGGTLTILAPPAFQSSGSSLAQTWVLPPGQIPSGTSILQLSSGSPATMNYAVLSGGGGVNISQSAGAISVTLTGTLDLPGAAPTLNDASGNPILALMSSGGGNYVKISNDTSGTNPAVGPVIGAAPGVGASSYAIPLQLSDQNGGGVELNSNGGLAMRVINSGTPANFVAVNASPTGTYGGQSGVRIGAGGTGNIALVLQAQSSGTVYVNSVLDTTNAPVVIDIPVDTTYGVTANNLVTLTTAGNARVSTGTAAGSIFGVSLNTTMATGALAQVAYNGRVLCAFDGAVTPGHFVTPSTTTAGECHDNGASYSVSVQTIGLVLDTSGNILIRH